MANRTVMSCGSRRCGVAIVTRRGVAVGNVGRGNTPYKMGTAISIQTLVTLDPGIY